MHAHACMQSNGLLHRAVTPSPRAVHASMYAHAINQSALNQSISQSVNHARCNPSQVLDQGSRLACIPPVVSRCQIIGRRGRVPSSAARRPLSTLCHHEKVTSRASVRSCRPSHLTDTPHLSDWAYIRLILRFLPPSTQSHDLVCMPPAVVATRARITRTLLVNAMQRMVSHDIPPCAARFMQKILIRPRASNDRSQYPQLHTRMSARPPWKVYPL